MTQKHMNSPKLALIRPSRMVFLTWYLSALGARHEQSSAKRRPALNRSAGLGAAAVGASGVKPSKATLLAIGYMLIIVGGVSFLLLWLLLNVFGRLFSFCGNQASVRSARSARRRVASAPARSARASHDAEAWAAFRGSKETKETPPFYFKEF